VKTRLLWGMNVAAVAALLLAWCGCTPTPAPPVSADAPHFTRIVKIVATDDAGNIFTSEKHGDELLMAVAPNDIRVVALADLTVEKRKAKPPEPTPPNVEPTPPPVNPPPSPHKDPPPIPAGVVKAAIFQESESTSPAEGALQKWAVDTFNTKDVQRVHFFDFSLLTKPGFASYAKALAGVKAPAMVVYVVPDGSKEATQIYAGPEPLDQAAFTAKMAPATKEGE
jgi:hypothetical protein